MASKERTAAGLSELWSMTAFDGAELSSYAQSIVFEDTRKGVVALGLVSLFLLAASALVYALLGYDTIYVYSSSVLAALSFHVSVSARSVKEIRALYLLGMTVLVVNGVAFVLLAHHAGAFNTALFASVILLFLLMPLVPWGLREAAVIVALVYAVFTTSTLSVAGRFDHNTLWMLQFAMITAGVTTLVVISRNTLVRRDDVKTRFELVKAHDHMELLSLKDPLTGAWNRRFLEEQFDEIRSEYRKSGCGMHFALIDIDDFKNLNDSLGHDYGDRVLHRLVANYLALFSGSEHMIRLGGDEFLLLMKDDSPVERIEQGATALRTDPQLLSASADTQVAVSIGLISVPAQSHATLKEIYRRADQALYRSKAAKEEREHGSLVATVLAS